MALQFSHAVGYRGVCKIGSVLYKNKTDAEGNPILDDNGKPIQELDTSQLVTILCTGGNINLTQEPIMGTGVWGGGYQNATPIAYAWNYLNLEGSANFELTKGNGAWSELNKAAFTDRVNSVLVQLLPDGRNGFTGPGWISSLSFEASEGAAITGSFNFRGDPSGDNITADGEGDTSKYGVGIEMEKDSEGKPTDKPMKAPFAGATLVPYWETNITAASGDGGESQETLTDIISWSCSYNSDIQMLKCCNRETSAPLSADYILLGDMTGDCNYTVFTLKGNFNPAKYHEQKKNLTFNIGTTTETDSEGNETTVAAAKIIVPLAIVNSASTSMATGASYITAEYSFTALGDGTGSIMKMEGDL